jgi:Arc/MetJ-type ribon-helix-helix transcriptional regulator
MTTQIAVRLPDEVVAFLDAEVEAGRARSRADLIGRALQRELRRRRAADDVARILAADDLDVAEFDALGRSVSATPLQLD